MVNIIFLGTGNAFGHKGLLQSSYILEGNKNILLDCGMSIFPAMKNIGYSILDIDCILLSHLHPDHYLGLPQFCLENYYVIKREDRIPIFCPIGTRKKIKEITKIIYNNDVYDHVDNLFEFFEFGENETREIPDGIVETFPAIHSDNARMQLITFDNKKIGYTGDSAFYPKSFAKLLEADLIISEASSSGFSIPDHTSLEELLSFDIPKNKKIYLSHLGESVIKNKNKIKPPLYLAYDGLKITI